MSVRAVPAARQRLASRLRGVQRLAVIGLARLLHWHELARQRRALLALDDHMLKDIGISRADAEREASRPFWSEDRAPVGPAMLTRVLDYARPGSEVANQAARAELEPAQRADCRIRS